MLPFTGLRLGIAGAAIAAIGLALWLGYSWAYGRGEAAREAYYAPILAAIREEAARAEVRSRTLEAEAIRRVARLTQEHQSHVQAIEARARDTERYFADRLREYQNRSRSCDVPAATGAPGVDDGAARGGGDDGGDARIDRLAARAAALAAACERDAARLKAAQEYIRSLPR